MNKIPAGNTIIKSLTSLFKYEKSGELSTPFLYPDGDSISLFFERSKNGQLIVSDGSETIRWILNTSQKIHNSQIRKIQNICVPLDVEFVNGELRIIAQDNDNISDIAVRVAQAAIRVSGINTSARRKTVPAEKMQDKLAKMFTKHKVSFQRNYTETGQSGKNWTIDFRTDGKKLINALPLNSDVEVGRSIDHIFTLFSDLQKKHNREHCYTVFSNNYEIDESDKKLLTRVSTTMYEDEIEKYLLMPL